MKITKKLSYGVDENTPKEFLYVKKIILRSYEDKTRNKKFMEKLKDFKIFQYNSGSAKDSDYFMWLYVDDEGNEHWNQVELCCYQNNMESIHKMWNLYEICKTTNIDINAEIQFGDVRNLINKIEKEQKESE